MGKAMEGGTEGHGRVQRESDASVSGSKIRSGLMNLSFGGELFGPAKRDKYD
jgi:hypothetical protein